MLKHAVLLRSVIILYEILKYLISVLAHLAELHIVLKSGFNSGILGFFSFVEHITKMNQNLVYTCLSHDKNYIYRKLEM